MNSRRLTLFYRFFNVSSNLISTLNFEFGRFEGKDADEQINVK